MVLLNYWRYLECIQRNIEHYSQLIDTDGQINWEVNAGRLESRYLNQNMFAQFSTSSSPDISPSDYSLSNQNNNIQFDSISTSISVEEGEGVKRVFTIIGRHTATSTGSNIPIYRVAVGKAFQDRGDAWHYVLFVEMDLEEPIIVQPHESFTITLSWNED